MAEPGSPDSGITFDQPLRFCTFDQVQRKLQNQGLFCDRRVLRSDTELWKNTPMFPKKHLSSRPSGAADQYFHEQNAVDKENIRPLGEEEGDRDDSNFITEENIGPRLDEAVDPVNLESQDVFSCQA